MASRDGNNGRKEKGVKGKPRAHWSDAQTKFLVSMMKEYHLSARYRGQNGWTKEAWNSMTMRLNNKFISKFTVSQLKDKEQRLKKDYNIVKSIVSNSGFGWDPEIKMATAIDEKWQELSEEQRKWRNKPFPYYDDLYDIYDGKVADGKRCRRTTDCQRANVNLSSQENDTHGNNTFFGTGSPDATRETAGYDFDLGYEDGIDLNAADSTFGDPIFAADNTQNPSADREEHTVENSAPSGRTEGARSTEKGPEKIRQKKNKDALLESLVTLRKEELESYKELKSKQIESYKQVKLAQMERNDPNNDPYSMAKCVAKLQELDVLSAPELMKTINYLKKGQTKQRNIHNAEW